MAPGRDLDIAVARLLGYTVVTAHSQSRTRRECGEPRIPELGFKPVPRYSTRMSAAWALTEWLWRKHQIRTVIRKTGHTQVTLESFAGGSPVAQVFEKRAPQAICEAALCLFALQ